MYSSRMCTIHSSIHLLGGCMPRGGVCLGGVCPGGVCPGGVYLRGVSDHRAVYPGGCISACTEADTPHVDRILDTRITFP